MKTFITCIGSCLILFATTSGAARAEGSTGPSPDAQSASQIDYDSAPIVTPNFTIGPEDVLDIIVWHHPDLSKEVMVRPDGRISLPLLKEIVAVGKTPSVLEAEIAQELTKFISDPSVAIIVKEVNSYVIFVLGEVTRPGKYPLKSKTDVLQGITIAGGFTKEAARNKVIVYRPGENGESNKKFTISYDDIVLRNKDEQNIVLAPGDTIVVLSEKMIIR